MNEYQNFIVLIIEHAPQNDTMVIILSMF